MNRLFSSALKNLDSEKPQSATQNSKLYSEQITNSIQRVPQFGQVISQEKKNSQNSRNQKTINEISKSTAEIIIQGLDDAEKAIKILQQTQLHGQNLKAVLQEEVNKGLSHNKSKKVINEQKGHIINI
ncbi:hypothetical protein PPERSA_10914 [Pseudocohnilembus persalinus]|uniref:Uncharacterized protein n=1 Tax=Pseudocohnilembus persalinus TaxID=266149 RepID=A0A0V0R9J4_PSEPJ|nr:hypothetical protein PPERSA_10914 [Pseudocohnilembus persalinus]|eukprot:KRX11147.1 hypothetical protein PPERSA_10914 [Pseudocohnilembus persalinus]